MKLAFISNPLHSKFILTNIPNWNCQYFDCLFTHYVVMSDFYLYIYVYNFPWFLYIFQLKINPKNYLVILCLLDIASTCFSMSFIFVLFMLHLLTVCALYVCLCVYVIMANMNDFLPYLVVLTWGTSNMFEYLKAYLEFFTLTKSWRHTGANLLTILYVILLQHVLVCLLFLCFLCCIY
jgi:hypothetical protein